MGLVFSQEELHVCKQKCVLLLEVQLTVKLNLISG